MIRAALAAGGSEGAEGRFLTAGAFDHHTLRTPLVDLTHLYVSNLVVRLDALDNLGYLRHWHLPLPQAFPQVVCSRMREYKGSEGTRLCPVTLSAPRHITSSRVSCNTSYLTCFCYTSYVIQIAR